MVSFLTIFGVPFTKLNRPRVLGRFMFLGESVGERFEFSTRITIDFSELLNMVVINRI